MKIRSEAISCETKKPIRLPLTTRSHNSERDVAASSVSQSHVIPADINETDLPGSHEPISSDLCSFDRSFRSGHLDMIALSILLHKI